MTVLQTDVERGLIGVGGGPYSLLLPRSKDFEQLGTILQLRFPDPLQITSLLSAFQLLWDRAEPMVSDSSRLNHRWIWRWPPPPHLSQDTLPNPVGVAMRHAWVHGRVM